VFPPTPQGDDALVASVAMTDTLVAPYFEAGRRLFRAPFGAWNARAFAVLEASPMHVYVGPIDWDIGDHRSATTGADWACWQNAPALATKACGDLFLMQITAVDRGIVLMHDAAYGNEANHALTAGVGNTVDMVKYLVPRLKAAGYAFVRVDHVPAIDAQLPPLPPAAPPSGPSNDAGTDHPPLDADAGPAATPTPTAAPPPTPDPCAAPETTRSAVAR
jgi:peptidoglycan/xylan/chitin deacetylase (PgdA/CDA1 family)